MPRTLTNKLATPTLLTVVLTVLIVVFAQAQPATVKTAMTPEHGTFLVDGDGRALYMLKDDPANESTCFDACAEKWPPLLFDGNATAERGVAASLFSTIERPDGSKQLAYSGLALYYYADDSEPGMTLGQGLGDRWYLVSNFGTAIVPKRAAETTASPRTEAIEPMLLSQLTSEGSASYTMYCAACHGADGQGGNGAVLKGAALGDDRRVVRQIVRGSGHMPAFGSLLNDFQVAAVVTYIRTAWGNSYPGMVEAVAAEHR
jgi:predicted lipoprotein with Yx(FWY)xxD motif/cytochrome c5